MRLIPAKKLLLALAAGAAAALLALLAGTGIGVVASLSAAWLLFLAAAASVDYVISRRAWQDSVVQIGRAHV